MKWNDLLFVIFSLISFTKCHEILPSSNNTISSDINVFKQEKEIKTRVFSNELNNLIENKINNEKDDFKFRNTGDNDSISNTNKVKENNEIPIQLQKYLICKRHCEKLNMIYKCGCDMNCIVYDDCCSMDLLSDCKEFHQEKYNYEVQLKAYENKLKSSTESPVANRNNEVIINEDSCCTDTPPKRCSCDNACEDFSDCCIDFKRCIKQDITKINKVNIKVLKPDLANKEKSIETLNKASLNSTIEILIDT